MARRMLNADDIGRLLTALDEELHRQGKAATIFIVGGAAPWPTTPTAPPTTLMAPSNLGTSSSMPPKQSPNKPGPGARPTSTKPGLATAYPK